MSRISLMVQEGTLKSFFPGTKVTRKGETELTWVGSVTPTPLSPSYTLRLNYKYKKGAEVFVIDPSPLKLAEGKVVLPHVYSTPKQQLCLYYPQENEWDTSMLYVKTLIPWACEWLFHYELWVCTGTWHGGGIHHEAEAEKQANKQKEKIDEASGNKK
ncbi:MAG: hypothetical protein IM606_17480 [Cytophagales bacterium]|jgi:hypothetical protein|nr:hypothetical protein [Cytophagales bacterium]MCA6390739.1 hypothetical protein [Cytophagales bacterium]MCA6396978.1 hypothetical protein [Cytophagales bacterium]MCA6403933.1 hypothetical protein [Cytophagales bacterium]MCA6405817.1 hypothetical protein [Cytophagales bacterium]